jgi:hypothetical protein
MKHLCITILLFCICTQINAQVGLNQNNAAPDSSAMLDVSSSNKGVLIPRLLKSQRDSIVNPQQSLLIYQTNFEEGFYYFTGNKWISLTKALSDDVGLGIKGKLAYWQNSNGLKALPLLLLRLNDVTFSFCLTSVLQANK